MSFSKINLYRRGARPVFYDNPDSLKSFLPKDEYWRIVNYNLDNVNNYIDWTHEREWRIPDELGFDIEDAHILLYNKESWNYFRNNCPEEIKNKVKGITILRAIIM